MYAFGLPSYEKKSNEKEENQWLRYQVQSFVGQTYG